MYALQQVSGNNSLVYISSFQENTSETIIVKQTLTEQIFLHCFSTLLTVLFIFLLLLLLSRFDCFTSFFFIFLTDWQVLKHNNGHVIIRLSCMIDWVEFTVPRKPDPVLTYVYASARACTHTHMHTSTSYFELSTRILTHKKIYRKAFPNPTSAAPCTAPTVGDSSCPRVRSCALPSYYTSHFVV